MVSALSGLAARGRILMTRLLVRFGFREETFLLLLAVVIGVVTAGAAVSFHELIELIRHALYAESRAQFLYTMPGVLLLVVIPALGGLTVGIFTRYVARSRESHGVTDVMESVVKGGGFINPRVAIEKILTAAITIGTGGSGGAEGPIVQIGAAIASGTAQFFHLARQHMPVILGCGTAAGISAIFNSPLGGVLFTLEVILFDFSLRAFTPVVLASVVANVTTRAIFRGIHDGVHDRYEAIFAMPDWMKGPVGELSWGTMPSFLVLGLACGLIGVSLTRLMYFTEKRFQALRLPRAVKPAIGGLLLGLLGVLYVTGIGWLTLETDKPIAFENYPMPAFFGDGYGVMRQLLGWEFYQTFTTAKLVLLLIVLTLAKLLGTCLTLGSGGSGGIIAPSLFLGATTGALLGMGMDVIYDNPQPQAHLYALIGMGAVLAAVVHAPLASILILIDLTNDPEIILPAMLAVITGTGFARLVFRDSIYTLSLRLRGVRVGTTADLSLLRRLSVEQVDLEPAAVVRSTDPLQKVLDLSNDTGAADFVVVDQQGLYRGMLVADDLKTALLEREAVPLLLVDEVMRPEVPPVRNTDDLATVLDTFSRYEISRLPVCISHRSGKVVGLVSRSALMKKYHQALAES